jgi:hypothetical protein
MKTIILSDKQQQVADKIKGALDQIREEENILISASQGKGNATHWNTRRGRNVVTLSGGRGWGKTTVLEMVLADLRHRQSADTIVLAPIYPEAFLVGDRPIGWIAASFAEHVDKLTEELRRENKVEEADKLDAAYHRFNTRVQWYLVPDQSAWASSRESTEQVADALSAAARSGFELCNSLNTLLNAIFNAKALGTAAKVNLRPLLVISFDDIDLHPERLDSILELLPSLASLPRVAIIVAADLELLRHRMRNNCDKFFGIAKNLSERERGTYSGTTSNSIISQEARLRISSSAKLTEDQMGKNFPWDMRFGLGELSLSERLDFCPVGTARSLRELFRSIRITDSTLGPKTFADFFDPSWNYPDDLVLCEHDRVTRYCHMLPGDPRSLTSLHAIVSRHERILTSTAITPTSVQEEMYRRDFFFFIRDFIEFLAQRHPLGTGVVESLFQFNSGNHEITIDCSAVDGNVRMRGGFWLGPKVEAMLFVEHSANYQDQPLSLGTMAIARFASEANCWPIELRFRNKYDLAGGIEDECKPLSFSESRRIGWPMPRFDSYLIHDAWQTRWTNAVEHLRSKYDKIDQQDMPGGAWLWLFWAYCRTMVDAVTDAAIVPSPRSFQADAPPETLWVAFVNDFRNCLKTLCEASQRHDEFAKSVAAELRTWASLHLSFLANEDMALDSKVAELSLDILTKIREASSGLGFKQGAWEKAEAEAAIFAERLRQPLPTLDASSIDLRQLAARLMERDERAVQAARYVLATSPPSKELAQVAELMRNFGYDFPSPERKLESSGSRHEILTKAKVEPME